MTSNRLRNRPYLVLLCLFMCGCTEGGILGNNNVLVWGSRGLGDARFQKPRGIAIDNEQNMYIIDMTGRIQVFDTDGEPIRFWRTPEFKNGKPCGLSISHAGELMVADTHYHRVLFYLPDGTLLESKTIGGESGRGPGQFGFVTDVVQDSKGNYYVSEYGDYDRIQKFDTNGNYVYEWGGHGDEPGHFMRPQSLLMAPDDKLWVADACNHRIQIFDVSGDDVKFVKMWGTMGKAVGQMRYPYSLCFDDNDHVYICEFGNHRVQKFTLAGKSLGTWGAPGRKEPGQMSQPWAMDVDGQGRIHILDSYNHRVQRFTWSAQNSPAE